MRDLNVDKARIGPYLLGQSLTAPNHNALEKEIPWLR
jgi:hypothetical protein